MARDYAPAALIKLGKVCAATLDGCRFSGVLGDKNHTYGYHRGRAVLPSSDYSVRLGLDKQGDKWAASALDISFKTKAQMKLYTSRLRKSAQDPNDHRLDCIREFYGTVNGWSVFGLIKNVLHGKWGGSTADSSHLSHIHISVFRKYSNDWNVLKGILDVLSGKPNPKVSIEEETIELRDALKALVTAIPFAKAGPGGRHTKKGKGSVSIKTELDYIWEDIETVKSRVDEILAILKEGK